MAQKISLIVARGSNGAIGLNGKMPWHIPEDLKHFKTVTMGCPVIMGRKTWDSIGRPLPGRRNIVLTRSSQAEFKGAERAGSLTEALALVSDARNVFIIGGAELYRQALPLVTSAWVTEIDAAPEADAFFPDLPEGDWIRTVLGSLPAAGPRPAVVFCRYDRR
jgi:dihydrofolate reductase